MSNCATCAGIGVVGGCVECGKDSNKVIPLMKQDVTRIAPILEKSSVPKGYLGVNWNVDIFWASHTNQRGNKLVEAFVQQLDKVHSIYASGGLPDRSALFMAPQGYSKMTWVFSCIQYAVKSGLSVAPVLDTLEIKRLFVLSSESPNRKLYSVDYEEYIDSDVLFFTVVKNEYRRSAYLTITDLLDKRSRRGLATIGISRFNMSEMSSWDSTGAFKQLSVPIPEVNKYKAPSIITCL